MPDRHVDRRVLSHSKVARHLLPVLFAILAAVIGGVTWRFYASQKELTERGVQSQLLTVADAKVKEISEWRKERLGEAYWRILKGGRCYGKGAGSAIPATSCP